MTTTRYDRNSYVAPGGLINAEAMRSEAVQRANRTAEATIIHHHRHGETCRGKHEYVTTDGIKEREL